MRTLVGASLLVSALLLSACSGTVDAGDARVVEVELSSVPGDLHLHSIGERGAEQYGFGTLHGTTTIDGRRVEIELDCAIDYVDGSGPFSGFWTFTFPNGDLLAFDYLGRATTDKATGVRSIVGASKVIGGTGEFVDASGSAMVTGSSGNATVGKNATYRIVLHVKGL